MTQQKPQSLLGELLQGLLRDGVAVLKDELEGLRDAHRAATTDPIDEPPIRDTSRDTTPAPTVIEVTGEPIQTARVNNALKPDEFLNNQPPAWGESPMYERAEVMRCVAMLRHAINSGGGMTFYEGCYALGVIAANLAYQSKDPVGTAVGMQSCFEAGFTDYSKAAERYALLAKAVSTPPPAPNKVKAD